MQNTIKPAKQIYTETEAADAIGVSVERLHKILDEHVFNDGSQRPEELTFTSPDIAMLTFWERSTPNSKLVRMPRRN